MSGMHRIEPAAWDILHIVRDKSQLEMAELRGFPALAASPSKSELKAVHDLNLTDPERQARNSGAVRVLDVFRPST